MAVHLIPLARLVHVDDALRVAVIRELDVTAALGIGVDVEGCVGVGVGVGVWMVVVVYFYSPSPFYYLFFLFSSSFLFLFNFNISQFFSPSTFNHSSCSFFFLSLSSLIIV